MTEAARRLGVSREHLSRAVHGKLKNPKLVARWRALRRARRAGKSTNQMNSINPNHDPLRVRAILSPESLSVPEARQVLSQVVLEYEERNHVSFARALVALRQGEPTLYQCATSVDFILTDEHRAAFPDSPAWLAQLGEADFVREHLSKRIEALAPDAPEPAPATANAS